MKVFLSTMLVAFLCGSGCGSRGGADAGSRRRDAGVAKATAPRAVRDGGTAAAARTPLAEATLASVQGTVEVDRRGRVQVVHRRLGPDGGVVQEVADGGVQTSVPGANDLELFIGDTVITGPDGSVELRLPEEGGLISVGPSSAVRVSRFGVNEILLVRGRMHAALTTPGRGRRVLKVATPTALVSIAGNDAILATADDGSCRLYCIAGTAKIRTAGVAEETEVAQGKGLEVGADGKAGRVMDAPPDAAAQADGWVNGRREVVTQEPSKVVRVLAKGMETDLRIVGPALDELQTRRDRNREILKRSSEARTRRDPNSASIQQELVENSRALVDATDLARSTVLRLLLRNELFQAIQSRVPAGTALGPGAGQIESMAPRIGEIRTRAEAQFRRFPKRPRRPGGAAAPGKLLRMPILKGKVQTQIPPEALESSQGGAE